MKKLLPDILITKDEEAMDKPELGPLINPDDLSHELWRMFTANTLHHWIWYDPQPTTPQEMHTRLVELADELKRQIDAATIPK